MDIITSTNFGYVQIDDISMGHSLELNYGLAAKQAELMNKTSNGVWITPPILEEVGLDDFVILSGHQIVLAAKMMQEKYPLRETIFVFFSKLHNLSYEKGLARQNDQSKLFIEMMEVANGEL